MSVNSSENSNNESRCHGTIDKIEASSSETGGKENDCKVMESCKNEQGNDSQAVESSSNQQENETKVVESSSNEQEYEFVESSSNEPEDENETNVMESSSNEQENETKVVESFSNEQENESKVLEISSNEPKHESKNKVVESSSNEPEQENETKVVEISSNEPEQENETKAAESSSNEPEQENETKVVEISSNELEQEKETKDVESSNNEQENETKDVESSSKEQENENKAAESSSNEPEQENETKDVESSSNEQENETKDVESSSNEQENETKAAESSSNEQENETKAAESSSNQPEQENETKGVESSNNEQENETKDVESSNNEQENETKDAESSSNKNTPKDARKLFLKTRSTADSRDALSTGHRAPVEALKKEGTSKQAAMGSISTSMSDRLSALDPDSIADLDLASPRLSAGPANADTRRLAKNREDRIAMPILLQPLCPRELLLSKKCLSQLAANNQLKGRISFAIMLITICILVVGHFLALPVIYYLSRPVSFDFDFPHVRTPCAVISNLDRDKSNLVFSDMPYASFTHRFEASHTVESFQDCYWHYYVETYRSITTFKSGVFYWNHEEMIRLQSDQTAWQPQWSRPTDTSTASSSTGTSERLSLSIATPSLDGKRPVILLVTGHDLTFNKPILPPPLVVSNLDCVVVTLNYRVGLDGAAVLNREDYMGNLFARDITQALLWLNRTVRDFGGDPERIVYFGEGSGATLGLWLMLSPEAVYLNRFWLMDPSVEIPTLEDLGSIVEDIFLEEPSSIQAKLGGNKSDWCYEQFKHRQPAGCLMSLSARDVLDVAPRWMRKIYNYLDEFPDKENRKSSERSLLHLPPSMTNHSLLFNLMLRKLKTANKPIVFHSSNSNSFYETLFLAGKPKEENRYHVETDLRKSLERVYIRRDSRTIGSAIVQQYVQMLKAEINEDEINYDELRRMLLHDIRTMCPIQAVMYHLLTQAIVTQPIYNLLDLSSYQSIPIEVTGTDVVCNLPRFLIHDFGDVSSGACRLVFDIGEEGQRQLREYRTAAVGILSDFAHGRAQPESHPHHLLAAVGINGSEEFEARVNLLDHRGNMPGMDTKRSQVVKAVCHELYGAERNDWNALLYMSRYN